MKPIFLFLPLLLMFAGVSQFLSAQTTEQDAYRTAAGMQNLQQRIEALNDFIRRYPDGKNLGRAHNDLFRIAVQQGRDSAALYHAHRYLSTIPEQARTNPYNSVAYTLAEKKMGLDSAAVYAQRAVSLAANGSKRALRQILDTQALVFFERGYPDSALVLQREAIIGNENDPSYLHYLSVYEHATGHIDDALLHSARAVLFGDDDKAGKNFEAWLSAAVPDESKRLERKRSIVESVAGTILTGDGADLQKKSDAALFMAVMGVDLQRAEQIAGETVAAINDRTALDVMISLKTNLAVIHSIGGNNAKALEGLLSVRSLVSPYDGRYWSTLGQLYEKNNDLHNARESYAQGLLAYEHPKVKAASDALQLRTGTDPDEMKTRIEQAKQQAIHFDPGTFRGTNETGRTVLAELFTGAECNPCVASDHAFDKLSEYYSRTDLAILEYHVHIPGPDPMTNPDTYKRYQFYGADFGTPTVFIDGAEKIVGGGGSINASNRFKVYDHLITKYRQRKPPVSLTGSAFEQKDNVTVSVTAAAEKGMTKKTLMLHVALAEKSVSYTGANGVSKHIFVVRDLAYGPEGTPLFTENKKSDRTVLINVGDVQRGIAAYLDDPTKDPSWRGTFSGWRERTDTIDRSNLSVVVWVQDSETKEVLQSLYLDVNKKAGKK